MYDRNPAPAGLGAQLSRQRGRHPFAHGRAGWPWRCSTKPPTARPPTVAEAIAALPPKPDVQLRLHVDSINAIERGVIDGSFTRWASSPRTAAPQSLAYADLFGETMLLATAARTARCLGRHRLRPTGTRCQGYQFAGLGYRQHGLSHQARLQRATAGV